MNVLNSKTRFVFSETRLVFSGMIEQGKGLQMLKFEGKLTLQVSEWWEPGFLLTMIQIYSLRRITSS